MMFRNRSAVLFIILAGIYAGCASSEAVFSCKDYDWTVVEEMVSPYLDDFEMTALIMQGQSSEYNTAAAADHALAFQESYPDSVVGILKHIQDEDCK